MTFLLISSKNLSCSLWISLPYICFLAQEIQKRGLNLSLMNILTPKWQFMSTPKGSEMTALLIKLRKDIPFCLFECYCYMFSSTNIFGGLNLSMMNIFKMKIFCYTKMVDLPKMVRDGYSNFWSANLLAPRSFPSLSPEEFQYMPLPNYPFYVSNYLSNRQIALMAQASIVNPSEVPGSSEIQRNQANFRGTWSFSGCSFKFWYTRSLRGARWL